jgi:hypothetical protein
MPIDIILALAGLGAILFGAYLLYRRSKLIQQREEEVQRSTRRRLEQITNQH